MADNVHAYDLWADRQQDLLRVALVRERKLVALEVDNRRCLPRAGARYIAKVLRVNVARKMAELDLGNGQSAFLNIRQNTPEAGQHYLVEWLAPARGDKPASVWQVEREAVAGPARLFSDGPDALERILQFAKGAIAQAHISAPDLQSRLDSEGIRCTVHGVQQPGLFELIDLEGQIQAVLSRVVPLAAGASLVFDTTEVGHCVDVNSGASEASLSEINRQALAEVARQIRLRNLGGIILVDLIGSKTKGSEKLLAEFKSAVSHDLCRVEVFGMTKLGLLEITRTRRGYPLARLLSSAGEAG